MQNIIAAVFKTESEGYQALTELSQNTITEKATIMQLYLVKRENNAFTVCDSFDFGIDTTDDMIAGGIIGGLMGVLGGPIGVLLLGSYGALVGSALDVDDAVFDETLIEKVADKMVEGEVALIALADEDDESEIDSRLRKFDVVIARFDAAVVAEEVEEAARVEREMNRLARMELRKEKKEEFKEKVEARREKIKADFEKAKKAMS